MSTFSSDPKFTPPIEPNTSFLHAAPVAVWPKVIGIISIVLGASGLCCNIWGIGFMLVIPMIPPDALAAMELSQEDLAMSAAEWVAALLSLAMSLFLIWIGTAFIRRRGGLYRMVVLWATIGLVLAVYTSVTTAIVQHAQLTKDDVTSEDLAMWIAVGSGVATLIFSAFYPIFLLIWCSIRKHRMEMATWGQRDEIVEHANPFRDLE